MTTFHRIDTVFLPVRDLDRAIAWYTETLGFSLRWKSGNYAALNVAETALTLYQPEGEFRPAAGHAPFNFYVLDPDAAHARLQQCGAKVEAGSRQADFAYFDFADPDGNVLGVCSFPQK